MGLDITVSKLDKKFELDFDTILHNTKDMMYWRKYYNINTFITSTFESICQEEEYWLLTKDRIQKILKALDDFEHDVYKLQAEIFFKFIMEDFDFENYYLIYDRSS